MAKISVACKLPNGYVAEHGGVSVEFAGANSPGAIGGFGITQGVDEAWFNAWWTANIDTPLVKNEIIFANTPAKVADEATAVRELGDKLAELLVAAMSGYNTEALPPGADPFGIYPALVLDFIQVPVDQLLAQVQQAVTTTGMLP